MTKKFKEEQLDNVVYSKYKFGEPEYDDKGNLNMYWELVEDENYNFCVDIFDDNDTEEEMFQKMKELQDKIRKLTDKNESNTDEIDYHAPLPSFESIQEYNKTLNLDDFKDITENVVHTSYDPLNSSFSIFNKNDTREEKLAKMMYFRDLTRKTRGFKDE